MVVGALLDLGIKKEFLIKELAKLGLSNYGIEIKKEKKSGSALLLCTSEAK